MGRPIKRTMDFFIHDAGAMDSNEMQAVMLTHGSHGYAVYYMFLEMLCHEQDRELCLQSPVIAKVVARRTGCRDEAHLFKVIDTLCDVGLLERQHWESSRIVFSLGLYERDMERMKANEKEALRKKQTRKAQWYNDQIHAHTHDPESDPENRKQNPESRIQKTDPIYTEASVGTFSDNTRTTELSGRTIPVEEQARDENATTARHPEQEDKQASQFMKRPWRKGGGQIEGGFLEFVGKQLPQNGGEHPKTKARSHILNLERGGPREKLEGYWQDYQDVSAVQAKPKTTLQAVRQVLTPEEYEAKLRAL